jgi:two-component system sensor histidine kinase UhpB
VGKGEYPGWLPAKGPRELMRVASGFNRMTEQLASADAQNHRLNERLLTLQAEERADLARDLHDEVGPLLFAVDMTAAAIERLPGGREAAIAAHAQSIHEAVARMQRHVRVILGRLRPVQTIGLQAAIERLVAFWHGRRPDISFEVAIVAEEDGLGSDVRETIYRVVQESVSNAMASTRLGLIGMRERVSAIAGSLSITPGRGGKGIAVVVRLPCEAPFEAQGDVRA